MRTLLELDFGKCIAHFAVRVASALGVTEAQLAGVVGAPAFDGRVIEDHTGVRLERGDGYGAATCPQVHGRQIVAHVIGGVSDRATGNQSPIVA